MEDHSKKNKKLKIFSFFIKKEPSDLDHSEVDIFERPRASGVPFSRLEEANQNNRFMKRIIYIQMAILVLGLFFISQMPSQIVSYPAPNLEKVTMTKLGDPPDQYVYQFADSILERINYCAEDCGTEYIKNLNNLSAYITNECKTALTRHYNNNKGLYLYRTRTIKPFSATNSYEINKVVKKREGVWNVGESYILEEKIQSKEIRSTKMFYPMSIIKVTVPVEINPFQLQFNCYSEAPFRVADSESENRETQQ